MFQKMLQCGSGGDDEVALKITPMTGEYTGSCRAYADNYRSGNEGYKAFDGDSNTYCISSQGGDNNNSLLYWFGKTGYIENISLLVSAAGVATSTTNLKIYLLNLFGEWVNVTDFTYTGNTSAGKQLLTKNFARTNCIALKIDNLIVSNYSCIIHEVNVNV